MRRPLGADSERASITDDTDALSKSAAEGTPKGGVERL
jgi:hypothetical protein